MTMGFIPRFSPSLSPGELRAAAWTLVRSPEDPEATASFEAAFAACVGVRHAIAVPSARFGFFQILRGWGLGTGDEVIVPALTYFAIPGMAVTAGLVPVFADVHPTTHTLDPDAFRAAITPRTRAVVPTHLFGTPADMAPILAIAREHGLRVIEDCAQSTGAHYDGRRVGSLGDAAYYTFGLTKNMTTLKGAMVTTDDDGLAERIRSDVARSTPVPLTELWREVVTGAAMLLATHPWVYPFTVHPAVRLGNLLGDDPIHGRFAEVERIEPEVSPRYYAGGPRAAQAVVGLAQLERLEALNERRRQNGFFLDEHLAHVPGLVRPTWPEKSAPIFMSYVVRHARRDALAAGLRRHGVDTTTGYMTDASSHPLFEPFARDCPNARSALAELLHLPVHPHLSEGDLHHLVEAVRLVCLALDT